MISNAFISQRMNMNYYKITKEQELHRNQQYRDGLNICVEPFYPSGDCTKGGMYFAREHILAFLGYGVWLRKVELLEESRVYKNPGTPRKWKTDKFFLHERRRITVEVIRELINEGADVSADNYGGFRSACRKEYPEIVQLLIDEDRKCISVDNYAGFRSACRGGHIDVVKVLLSESIGCISASDYEGFWLACKYGHMEVVKLLIEADKECINISNYIGFWWACNQGHIEVVKLLLEYCKEQSIHIPDDILKEGYQTAKGHIEIVKLLKEYIIDDQEKIIRN